MASFDGSDDLDIELRPTINRMDEYKIYVNNIPEELNEDAIKEVFNLYGTITAMFYRPNATWAYVTFGTYREAEHAIRELNNKKPLYLKVALAKERPVLREECQQFDTSKPRYTEKTPVEPIVVPDMKHLPQGIGRGYAIRKCFTVPDEIVPHHYAQNKEAQVLSSLSSVSNPYIIDDPYMSTNRLWTRGMLTVTADGKRHVSFGRGYTMYEIPEPHPKIEDYITQVYELRKNGLYEYGDDNLKSGLQRCVLCSVPTTRHCEKCCTYYCSRTCQMTHWPEHRSKCERIPDLIEEIPLAQINKSEDTKSTSNTRINPFSDVKLRRPNTPVKVQDSNVNIKTTTKKMQAAAINKTTTVTDKSHSSNQFDDNVAREKNVDQSTVNNTTTNQSAQNRFHRYNANGNTDNQSKRNCESSLTSNHTLQNNYTRHGTYNRQNNYNHKHDVAVESYPNKENNRVDTKGEFNSSDKNYDKRDGVQNVRRPYNQHENTTNKQGPNQRPSMQSMDTEKTMTVEVEKRAASLTSMRATKNSSCALNVENAKAQEEKLMSPSSSPLKSEKPLKMILRNVFDGFADLLMEKAVPELTIEGSIQVFKRTDTNTYIGMLITTYFKNIMDRFAQDLPKACAKIAKTVDNYKPQVGDLVCSEIENNMWCRGYVVALSPELQVSMVDEAKIVSGKKVLPYPTEFLDICSWGIVCEVTSTQLQIENVYPFTGVIRTSDVKQGSLKVNLKINDKVFEATIKPWQSINNQPDKLIPALAELRNGSKILLSSYQNQYTMFVQSLDEAEMEYSYNMMQRVARCSQTAPRLSEPPSTQQMVIAPYHDGNNYRAMIIEILDDNMAKIVYVDFGNRMKLNINELLEIPYDLGIERSCSAKITLKDVPRDMPINEEVEAYLRDLIGREEVLVCTYENGLIKNGANLTTSSGESVNDQIKQLLVPRWKRENYDDKRCFMLTDIQSASLGNVGDTVQALVLHKPDEGPQTYIMGPSKLDLVNYITDVLPSMLKEYCEKTEYYIPRKEELCLALYDGEWYRAVCLSPNASHTTCEIYFVDYGNVEEVAHKNVRMMPEDFIKPESMANICVVVNLAPVDDTGNYSDAVQQTLSELVVINGLATIKIVECIESGEYRIELPDVRKALVEKGLV